MCAFQNPSRKHVHNLHSTCVYLIKRTTTTIPMQCTFRPMWQGLMAPHTDQPRKQIAIITFIQPALFPPPELAYNWASRVSQSLKWVWDKGLAHRSANPGIWSSDLLITDRAWTRRSTHHHHGKVSGYIGSMIKQATWLGVSDDISNRRYQTINLVSISESN